MAGPESYTLRKFESGATRDNDTNKLDYEGFESPLVTKRFAEFMHKNRKQPDGSMRGSDNWQKGIPKEAYVKSLVRHVEDVKLHWDGYPDEAVDPDFESALCAVIFNAQGLLYELLRDKRKPTLTGEPGGPPVVFDEGDGYRKAFGKFAAGKV